MPPDDVNTPSYPIWDFPVQRPGFVKAAEWIGGNEQLRLECTYEDEFGDDQVISFDTEGEEAGQICLPATKTINDITDSGGGADTFIAHLRMATLIDKIIIGSATFDGQFISFITPQTFTMAVGSIKIAGKALVSAYNYTVYFQDAGGLGPLRGIEIGHDELTRYRFQPSTQLLVIPGTIEYTYPAYVHDANGAVYLSTAQKANIVTLLLNSTFWI
jgi:hypothetical protein